MARRLRNQTIREGLNTDGANDFAKNPYNSAQDVKLNWWGFFSNYRIKKWKQELKNLCEKTGVSLDDVCQYMGIQYSALPGFYRKLPKSRETYIGIGMAYRLPLERINRWIVKYGGKKKLYVKDALYDLIWIYLIHANASNAGESEHNYYQKFEECRASVEEIYNRMNIETDAEDVATAELDEEARRIVFDTEYIALKAFVRDHIKAFHSAYASPKNFIRGYIDSILRVKNENRISGRSWTLNTLRGDLDDSMINYLTSGIKYVPKSKKTHISMGLAVGMTTNELNQYLQMLGYAPLDGTHLEEGILLNLLEKWEEAHPVQRQFKEICLKESTSDKGLKEQEKMQAVNEMLGLRSDLKEAYEKSQALRQTCGKSKKFPYMNE